MSEERIQVTKPKHPGRVESGKRLVEWNRKNKENILKEPNQVAKNLEQEPAKEPNQEPGQVGKSYDAHMVGVGALAILAIGLLVYFHQKSPGKLQAEKPEKDIIFDPFRPV